MVSRKSVHSTHIKTDLRVIHGAVVDILGVMNQPQRDAMMIEEAGISLDRALFPLLVGIGRFGPIGVVDLADRVGRERLHDGQPPSGEAGKPGPRGAAGGAS